MSESVALAEVRHLSKRFGATRALSDVSCSFHAGQVHALIGENGAGKSTLGKVLLGVHRPDEGELLVDGTPVALASPRDAVRHGFAMVAQELSLIPALTVGQNVVLGSEHWWLESDRTVNDRVRRLADEFGLAIDPARPVRSLGVADQQKVEILRALARNLRLVLLDEPTARLASHEANDLRATVRRLADQGVAVVFVSHFLDEVLAIADTVTVMRDGRVVHTRPAADETKQTLVEAMTGREGGVEFPALPALDPAAPEVLRVRDLTKTGQFRDVSISVRAGEIVGMAGLVGAGRSEVAMAILGATRPDAGSIEVDGRQLAPGVAAALRSGVTMIPESRRDQGLFLKRSVAENAALPSLRTGLHRTGLSTNRIAEYSAGAVQRAGVRTPSLTAPVGRLSGGNQQKVLFARSLLLQPRLLLADEPTRGVDVGAKQAIYQLIVDMAAQGLAVLLISSEMEEILALSHRVLVMARGQIVGELTGPEITERAVLDAAFELPPSPPAEDQ